MNLPIYTSNGRNLVDLQVTINGYHLQIMDGLTDRPGHPYFVNEAPQVWG